MNILLVNPQYKKTERSYPLGLGYIASLLRSKEHKVFGVDLAFDDIDAVMAVIGREEIGLVCVSIMSYNLENAERFIQEVRSRYSVPVVIGGPHATVMREELFRTNRDIADFIVAGEGEITISELVLALEYRKELSGVSGLIWKRGEEIMINRDGAQVDDLDQLPFPDRDIFPLHKYKGMISRNHAYTQIITSRGCPHRCSYCPEPSLWQCYRKRSPENVVDEMQEVAQRYGICEFHIEDSNLFGGDVERIKRLCAEILRRGLKVDWQCPNGIPLREINDLSVIDLMARAGCYHIALGVESIDEKTTLSVGREQSAGMLSDIVKRCKQAGMEVSCYLIIGFPGQKLTEIRKDIRRARKLDFDFIQYSIFHLIPGSKMYEEYRERYPLSDLINGNVLVSQLKFSLLKRTQRFAYFFLCFKPSVIIYSVKRLFYTRDITAILRRFYQYVCGRHLTY